MTGYAAAVFREDSALWDVLIISTLLLVLGALIAVVMDARDGR